jgi:nucleotide-binding universal stress UspA family protein
MYRILVAVDGSEHSRRAVDYAVRRAKDVPCRIDLLHVEKPVMAWEVGPVASVDAVSDARAAESRDVLKAAAVRFDRTTEVETHVARGEPAATILEQASKLAVDEIVIGSRGMRPVGAALLGSVAYEVLHEAKVAVVVVR